MKPLFLLLALLLIADPASEAAGLKSGGIAQYNVELPEDLRVVAGQGTVSPVAHALVTVAVPADLDMAHVWPVLVVSATSDRLYNSSRRLMDAYASTALKAGWVVVAADPAEEVPPEKDGVALRLALNTAALAVLKLNWPAGGEAPLAFGGFSGGAKHSGWLAAAFAGQGRVVMGIYLAGINTESVVSAARTFKILDANFKRIPVFLQSGDHDEVATPADHRHIYNELKRAGFENVRIEKFVGAHDIYPAPLGKALEWFREVAASAPLR